MILLDFYYLTKENIRYNLMKMKNEEDKNEKIYYDCTITRTFVTGGI